MERQTQANRQNTRQTMKAGAEAAANDDWCGALDPMQCYKKQAQRMGRAPQEDENFCFGFLDPTNCYKKQDPTTGGVAQDETQSDCYKKQQRATAAAQGQGRAAQDDENFCFGFLDPTNCYKKQEEQRAMDAQGFGRAPQQDDVRYPQPASNRQTMRAGAPAKDDENFCFGFLDPTNCYKKQEEQRAMEVQGVGRANQQDGVQYAQTPTSRQTMPGGAVAQDEENIVGCRNALDPTHCWKKAEDQAMAGQGVGRAPLQDDVQYSQSPTNRQTMRGPAGSAAQDNAEWCPAEWLDPTDCYRKKQAQRMERAGGAPQQDDVQFTQPPTNRQTMRNPAGSAAQDNAEWCPAEWLDPTDCYKKKQAQRMGNVGGAPQDYPGAPGGLQNNRNYGRPN